MTFGKRQLVIASLVMALGAAVYLNWQFSDAENIIAAESETSTVKQLGQTTYVNTEITSTESTKTESSEISQASTQTKKETSSKSSNTAKKVNAEVSSDYFSNEKKKRDLSNEKSLDSLAEILEAAEDTGKKEAQTSAEKLASNIKLQTDIENEICTKGFDDALVIINNDNCSVTVHGGKLDNSSAIVIKDIVNRQAGIDFDKITVSDTNNK